MGTLATYLLEIGLKFGAVLVVANEVRGIILTAPVFYGIYQAGGTMAAIWLGLCSLGGIALSVIVPVFAARKLKAAIARKQARPAG
ncbi:hypothetical protein [Erythrobacter neustonensis]|uniref:Uncharacterized protein n=1 Tax=Erythrobacter neustonensis TaxID=1112 RepID=A0A192D0N8_9SPHN|nr:hypothetical protein [Erythrobacter neustonensis]ANK12073.1 hypothetical protein A9D12_03005 [Erythrobacter neustonensis]